MSNEDAPKYDLEERTFQFAKKVRQFVKRLPRTICNLEDVKQLVRAQERFPLAIEDFTERSQRKFVLA